MQVENPVRNHNLPCSAMCSGFQKQADDLVKKLTKRKRLHILRRMENSSTRRGGGEEDEGSREEGRAGR